MTITDTYGYPIWVLLLTFPKEKWFVEESVPLDVWVNLNKLNLRKLKLNF